MVCTETAADTAAHAWIRTGTSGKERQNYLPTYSTMQLVFDRDIMLTSHLLSLLLLLSPYNSLTLVLTVVLHNLFC